MVKKKLAEGGMAEIFLCAAQGPEGFEKEVVLKKIRRFLSSDPTFVDMFKAEAKLASRLNHANIVQIFDFGLHDDSHYLAMEFIHGASLWELRRRCRELGVVFPSTLAAEIAAQVARGLHYAHSLTEKGKPLALVHRDVTPHNVLLSFDGAVKLTDFGIAKAGTSHTAPGMLKGKFAYMSPEQARGEKVDARTDVFALGIVLWEMLTGARLFEGDSDVAVLRAVQDTQIAAPSRVNPEVPVELSDVVLRALNRKVDERYQTAQDFERALANFVLRNAVSVEDTNVSAFLRQMFRDELEAAEASARESGTVSKTPIVVVPPPENQKTQQAVTPEPEPAPLPPTSAMPGLRASKRIAPLLDDDDDSRRPTNQMSEFKAAPLERTAYQQAPSRPLPVVPEGVDALPLAPPASQRPSQPIREPREDSSPPRSEKARSRAPWAAALGGALILVLAVGFAMNRSKITPTLEVTAPPAAPITELPRTPVDAPAQPPVAVPEAVVPAKHEEPVAAEPVAEVKPDVKTATSVARGLLEVDARPYAILFINNKKYGEIEGLKKISLPVGTYGLRLEHPRLTKTAGAVIKAKQTERVEFRLE